MERKVGVAMGGRGSSRGGGSLGTRGHLGDMTREQAIAQVRSDLIRAGKDPDQAEAIVNAVHAYSIDYFIAVRDAQMGRKVNFLFDQSTAEQYGRAIEDYIAASPSMPGTIYRGMTTMAELDGSMTIDVLRQAQATGSTISMEGTSSWTDSLTVARTFADSSLRGFYGPDGEEYDGRLDTFIFRATNVKRSASVQHLASETWQREVLVSKDARFRVTGISQIDGNRYLVDVEEV